MINKTSIPTEKLERLVARCERNNLDEVVERVQPRNRSVKISLKQNVAYYCE